MGTVGRVSKVSVSRFSPLASQIDGRFEARDVVLYITSRYLGSMKTIGCAVAVDGKASQVCLKSWSLLVRLSRVAHSDYITSTSYQQKLRAPSDVVLCCLDVNNTVSWATIVDHNLRYPQPLSVLQLFSLQARG